MEKDMQRRGIIYIDENYAEFGMIEVSHDNIRIFYEGSVVWGISYEALKDHLGFDYLRGLYVIGKDVNHYNFPFGRDAFPYNLDNHTYNMKFEEHLFKGKQKIANNIEFKYIDELPYTFGLEFETAGGYLPQHQLYELGLIPLRDGSITGIEFSTVVLQGNSGLNLLKKQMEILNNHTIFDKDCSLHIHFGGFKLSPNVLLKINNIFINSNIKSILPEYTFFTHRYKTNTDKNYCEYNTRYTNFEEMYALLVNRNYLGDLYQPHPNDINGTRKWCIKSRYKAVNFINALCYNGPKTVEYRMLRPSYNFDKILGWLFVLGAIIKYAEKEEVLPNHVYRTNIQLQHIIRAVYSNELADLLVHFLHMCSQVTYTQHAVGDRYGMRVDIDDKVINYQSFGRYFY